MNLQYAYTYVHTQAHMHSQNHLKERVRDEGYVKSQKTCKKCVGDKVRASEREQMAAETERDLIHLENHRDHERCFHLEQWELTCIFITRVFTPAPHPWDCTVQRCVWGFPHGEGGLSALVYNSKPLRLKPPIVLRKSNTYYLWVIMKETAVIRWRRFRFTV